jgi:hypothetical protein
MTLIKNCLVELFQHTYDMDAADKITAIVNHG